MNDGREKYVERIVESCRLDFGLFASDNFISDSFSSYFHFNFKCSTTVTVRADSCWYFNCGFSAIIIGARKTQLASFNFSFFRAKDLARLGLSYLVIICSNILGSILLQLSNETTTANQSQINDMVQNSSLISSFFLLALLAPICEEILCRGIVPKKIFRGKENLGFVVGTIVFALLHQPSNLPSLLIYGGMSIVLSWTAYKTQRLEMSILLHMIVNGVAFCLLALVVILSRTLGISV